jgi:polysaccharide export outer membrane protein
MRRWIQVLIVLSAVFALAPSVGAEDFGNTYQGDSGKSEKKATGQFAPATKAQPATRTTNQSGSFGASGSASSGGYKLGPQDVLEISVFGVPELTGTLVVADNGTIQLPLLGETPAAGKTARDLQLDLAAKLGEEYLQNPQVLVTVKEFNSRSVTLTGEIKKPGVYPLKGQTSLLQLIASAGGVGDGSDSKVLIIRNSGGQRKAARFDVSAIEKGKAQDPILQAGDNVVAGGSVIKKSYNLFLKALPIAGMFAIL